MRVVDIDAREGVNGLRGVGGRSWSGVISMDMSWVLGGVQAADRWALEVAWYGAVDAEEVVVDHR